MRQTFSANKCSSMSMTRPRLLYLTQCLPYPPNSGVMTRTLHILEELQAGFDVVLVPFYRRQHHPDVLAVQHAYQALGDRLSVVQRPTRIPNEHSRVRLAWDHLRSVALRRPYVFYEYQASHFRNELRNALSAGKPDLIHLDSMDLYGWLDELPGSPIVCTHHNIESDLLVRQANHTPNPALAWYIGHQAQMVRGLERRYAGRFALNLMTSKHDAARLTELAPGSRTHVIPNGVDTEYFVPRAGPPVPGRLAFLGPTYMYPNRDGVEFFLSEVWPSVRRQTPGATLSLIGAPGPCGFGNEPGVTEEGFLPDIRPCLAQTTCFIVPLRIGGGTRLKILDAWAMGKAIVSTSVGCEGLQAVDGENILIRDTAGAFAEAVNDVLVNEDLRHHLESNARRTVEEVYSWARIGAGARKSLMEVMERNPTT